LKLRKLVRKDRKASDIPLRETLTQQSELWRILNPGVLRDSQVTLMQGNRNQGLYFMQKLIKPSHRLDFMSFESNGSTN
jgi:hypothetical protein